jgi:hypothetical protein
MTTENLILQEITEGSKISLGRVAFPPELTETFASLYQNAASPVVFSADNATPTPWNAGNVGAITAGNTSNSSVDTTTGEIILDEAGDYDLLFEGSVASTNPYVQLCIQIFVDGVGQDNMCDFPTTHSMLDKYVAFSGGDLTLAPVAAGAKVDIRFLAVESQAEDISLRNLNLKARKKKK